MSKYKLYSYWYKLIGYRVVDVPLSPYSPDADNYELSGNKLYSTVDGWRVVTKPISVQELQKEVENGR